jgi:hypothetical protein
MGKGLMKKSKKGSYTILYYVPMKLKGLLLVLTSNVSDYTIIIEL